MFTVSANMKTQDIWFLLLISAIWTELRLVGDNTTGAERLMPEIYDLYRI
jgi:hypothetical protein